MSLDVVVTSKPIQSTIDCFIKCFLSDLTVACIASESAGEWKFISAYKLPEILELFLPASDILSSILTNILHVTK